MKLEGAALIIAGAIATRAIAPSELSDVHAMGIASAAGVIGGFSWSLLTSNKSKTEPLRWFDLLARVIACAGVAPALVLWYISWVAGDGDVKYEFAPVFASSCVAGLLAWPLVALVMRSVAVLMQMSGGEFKDLCYRVMLAFFPGAAALQKKDKPDKDSES